MLNENLLVLCIVTLAIVSHWLTSVPGDPINIVCLGLLAYLTKRGWDRWNNDRKE